MSILFRDRWHLPAVYLRLQKLTTEENSQNYELFVMTTQGNLYARFFTAN